MNRFSEESLRSVLIGNTTNSCSRVLLLYYILFFTDYLIKYKIEERNRGSSATIATTGSYTL